MRTQLPATGDYRSAGEHDIDRILYSSAYRRLTGVTQVVAVGERQLFHNRLTHTQKVASLSRRIAQYLNREKANKDVLSVLPEGRIDEDVAEAAGLAHDLGHPPFGHIAETVLNRLCLRAGTDGFEGNAQSFRIVTKLGIRREGANLDLSRRTLDGILKYPWLSSDEKAKSGKWGAYLSERAGFESVRGTDGPTTQSVEASIMDWADDISYAVHDLEDFYRAGFIRLAPLVGERKDSVAVKEFVGKALKEWKYGSWSFDDALEDFSVLGRLLLQPVKGDFDGSVQARAAVNGMGSTLISQYVSATDLDEYGIVQIAPSIRKEVHLLKQLTWQSVINAPALATLQRGQERVIEDLFRGLNKWIKSEGRQQRLPTRLNDLLTAANSEEHANERARRGRAIADYICCLTEDQALDLHARLRGYTRGSIQDTWVAY